MLHWLGIKRSYSRPRVSDDSAFAESLFRTAKYRPEFPDNGFASLPEARCWGASFAHWYNHDHRHTRNWKPIEAVTLNPERDSVVEAELANRS